MLNGFKAFAALAAAFMLATIAGEAYAQCCNVPSTHQVRVPGVSIVHPRVNQGCGSNCGQPCDTCGRPNNVSAEISVSAQASANAQASALTGARALSFSSTVNGSNFYGSSGSSFYTDYNTGYIPNLAVEEGLAAVSVPYQASRTTVKLVVIQAVCIDDRLVPHPASQVTPDKEIGEAYDGELYRCLAGTRLQYTWAEYLGKVSFDKGQTATCEKNDALWRSGDGKIECRPQKPARDCNERSLLRRYGAGIKIVKMVWVETYTAYRTEYRQAQAQIMGMVIDGGVGGVAH